MLKIQEHEQEVIQMRKYLSEFSIKVNQRACVFNTSILFCYFIVQVNDFCFW